MAGTDETDDAKCHRTPFLPALQDYLGFTRHLSPSALLFGYLVTGASLGQSRARRVKLALQTGSIACAGHRRAVAHLNSVEDTQGAPAQQGAAKVSSLRFVKRLRGGQSWVKQIWENCRFFSVILLLQIYIPLFALTWPYSLGARSDAGLRHGNVITGGHYDVDCRLEDPDGIVLYKEMKKQYDSFTFTASRNGTYKFCFSNEFSTFTHKTVYFDFQVGEDPPLFPSENRVTALTQMESACVSIHEALKSVIDYQTHFRLREAQGRSRAEDLNTRVAYWSIGEAIILLVVSIGQVFLLKSFFSDKRTTTTRVGS
ncbi:PREDICTED: transmembrane emp24 domain-containing protein 7-like [Pygoscelis adeliae]|uniref:transmembrane emp24 domain-containing protein 7-like n=1 Tax=Pygoscelis adeliae TaxID=9238 RepID=UPI0004F50116|nr:PREDICTED: transmembrane emp24 domain-containing protein 7-like [Pygoscelis adeliae]